MTKETIFFSYARADSDFALKLAKDLRLAGAGLWIDQLDIKAGSHWDASVEAALTNASRLIVILSPSSVASNNVMDEVSFALENGKSIIPLLLSECAAPFRLRRLQRVDFTTDYETGLNQLLKVLDYAGETIVKTKTDQPSSTKPVNKKEEDHKAVNETDDTNPTVVSKDPPSIQPAIKKKVRTKYSLLGAGIIIVGLGIWGIIYLTSGEKGGSAFLAKGDFVTLSSGLQIEMGTIGDTMTYDEAKKYCDALGNGWRLPNRREMLEIYERQKKTGAYFHLNWTSEEYDSKNAWYQGADGRQVSMPKKFKFEAWPIRNKI